MLFFGGGGRHSTVVAFTLPDPAAPGSIPCVPKIFPRKKIRRSNPGNENWSYQASNRRLFYEQLRRSSDASCCSSWKRQKHQLVFLTGLRLEHFNIKLWRRSNSDEIEVAQRTKFVRGEYLNQFKPDLNIQTNLHNHIA